MAIEHSQARLFVLPRTSLAEDVSAFITDCQARRLSHRTIQRYQEELHALGEWLEGQGIKAVLDIRPEHLRNYLIHLAEEHKRNAGGQHIAYRVMRTFLKWHEREFDHWGRNPISKVRAPKLSREPLAPVPLEHIKAMLDTCSTRGFTDMRDKALIMMLLDTGARSAELLALDIDDVNVSTGATFIRHGKGGKGRVVYIGAKTRRELSRYLRLHRQDIQRQPALWIGVRWERLTHAGLWRILERRAKLANVPIPAPHSFRRAFAILSLRGGMDMESLRRLLGHSDLSIISRYLRQDQDDLRNAHAKAGPVDNLL